MKNFTASERLLQFKQFINPLSANTDKTENYAAMPREIVGHNEFDLDTLPSADNLLLNDDSTAFVEPILEPLYNENVLAELEETMPLLVEVDIASIPNFYADDIEGDSMAAAASLVTQTALQKDKKEFAARWKNLDLTRLNNSLGELMEIEGAVTVAAVDVESGFALGSAGSGVDIDVAASGNSGVVKTKRKLVTDLGLKDEIEDLLITLDTQYHLIRLTSSAHVFIYLVLDRAQANLALARRKLTQVESAMQF